MRGRGLMRAGVGLAVLLTAGLPAVRGDVVRLKGGGKVVGKVVSVAGGRIRIRTVAGTLSFSSDQAVSVEYGPTLREQYAQRAGAVDRTDPDALLALAEWCDRNGLNSEAREYLKAVVALDPDHVEARRRLGYVRVGADWLTEDEAMRRKGLVPFGGRWVTPAERDRLEKEKVDRRIRARWYSALTSIVRRLESSSASLRRRAAAELRAIEDPLAIGPLAAVIGRTDEADVRRRLVAELGRFRDDRALDALIDISLLDDAAPVRGQAVSALVARNDPRVPAEVVRALKQDSWHLKLRACYLLGELRSFEAVPFLIDNLSAIEGFREEVSWRWRRGGFSHGAVSTYIPAYRTRAEKGIVVIEPVIEHLDANGGIHSNSGWERRTVVRKRPVRTLNTEAWAALVKISGRDYGYYDDHWRAWYERERAERRRRRTASKSRD